MTIDWTAFAGGMVSGTVLWVWIMYHEWRKTHPRVEPEVGDIWFFSMKGDPWRARITSIKIIDKKDGWVKYVFNSNVSLSGWQGMESTCKVSKIMRLYKKEVSK
jgi:hypothetical protein